MESSEEWEVGRQKVIEIERNYGNLNRTMHILDAIYRKIVA